MRMEVVMETKKLRLYVSDIAIDVFYERSIDFSKPKQAFIVLPGFPDFVGPTTLTTLLISSGKIVFQPHLRGTFDSSGQFAPTGIKESLFALNDLVWNSKGSSYPNGKIETQSWIIDSIVLVGHSFGGILVLRYFTEIANVDHIILTSPALHYAKEYGCKENGPEHYREVEDKYPFTYRLARTEDWNGIIEGLDMIPAAPIGKVKKILTLYGENDKYFNIEKVKNTALSLIKAYISTDEVVIKIIKGSGHPLAELLDLQETRDYIISFCER